MKPAFRQVVCLLMDIYNLNAMAKKNVTLDQVLAAVNNGFTALENKVTTKEEFHAFQQVIDDRFRLIQADLKDIKTTLTPLMGIVTRTDKEVNDLRNRIAFVEQKLGIIRKKG